MLNVTYRKLLGRCNNKCPSLFLRVFYVSQFRIIHLVTFGTSTDEIRVLFVYTAHKLGALWGVFYKSARLSQYNNIFFITLFFHKFQRDRIRYAAVKEFSAVNIDYPCGKRHRSRRAQPFKLVIVHLWKKPIHGLSRSNIRGNWVKFHRVLIKSFCIEYIKLFGNCMVNELCTVHISRQKQRADAAILPLTAKTRAVANNSSRLTWLIIAAKACSCGNSDSSCEFYFVFHEHVYHTCGEQTAHCSSLEDKTVIHITLHQNLSL